MNIVRMEKPKSAPFRCFEDNDDMFVEQCRNPRISGTFVPSDSAAVAAVKSEFLKPLPPPPPIAMDGANDDEYDGGQMNSSDSSIEKIDLVADESVVEVVSSDMDD